MDITELIIARGYPTGEASHVAEAMSDEATQKIMSAEGPERARLIRQSVYDNHKSAEEPPQA